MSLTTMTVSRVKRNTPEEELLRMACELAAADRRPFSITHGYDHVSIGAYTEFVIQHGHTEEEVSDGKR